MKLILFLLKLVGVLICIAFFILIERSVLGYFQLRKGPNSVGLSGLLQSFSDGVKLFLKESLLPMKSNKFIYYYCPIMSLCVGLLFWSILPTQTNLINLSWGGLFFFCCMGMGVYSLVGSGWSSSSNYSMIGGIRGVAQTISYEVCFFLLYLNLVILISSYSLTYLIKVQHSIWLAYVFWMIFFMWVICGFAETNRTPFDFSEGESELVSGFNIEYGGGGFSLLFLSEYSSIFFMNYMSVIVFLGGVFSLWGTSLLLVVILSVFYVFIRGCLPRYRYDMLMYLSWKIFLPVGLFLMIFFLLICWMLC